MRDERRKLSPAQTHTKATINNKAYLLHGTPAVAKDHEGTVEDETRMLTSSKALSDT